ncbi:Ig domain-containing protein [Vagococcus sp. BWB3-3]|uniref:Ig domain-containing protein n=1 Tax=Vagococcus allomyrinae TaxID=2794353 RepID=A0A940SUF6_9ENTE|nr:Ig-like domain-containing protein [Vagococcus allomyrinae]MBP1040016.1 Ig domain-containing protein [Vagococcus allomyrinae]
MKKQLLILSTVVTLSAIALTAPTADAASSSVKLTATSRSTLVTDVELSQQDLTAELGNTYQLDATVSPTNAANTKLVWSSTDTKIAKVSQTGVVTPVKAGSVTIVAESSDGSFIYDFCQVTVIKGVIHPTKVAISPSTRTVKAGDTYQLKATVTPTNAANKLVKWTSSDDDIAEVTNGLVYGKSAGTTTITAETYDGGIIGTATINVTGTLPTFVSDIQISEKTLAAELGNTYQLSATVTPSDATNSKITWKSGDTSIAKVSQTGLVTPVKEGSVAIIAEASDGSKIYDYCQVTIKKGLIHPTKVAISPSSRTIKAGDKYELKATVTPSTVSIKTVEWSSSDPDVADVTNGIVYGKTAGTTTITAKSYNGIVGTATINVTGSLPTLVSGIQISEKTLAAELGNTYQLSATVTPSNAANSKITWKSGDTTIAKVSQTGLVTPVKEGSVAIIAEASDGSRIYDYCQVTIKKGVIHPTKVVISPSSRTIKAGDKYELKATVTPSNAAFKTVEWSSSDAEVAEVTNGVVYGKTAGTTIITAKTHDGGIVGTATINVTGSLPTVITNIQLSQNTLTTAVGQTHQFTAAVEPSNAANSKLTWISTDPSIVRVTQTGQITSLKEGKASIIAEASDGSRVYDYCDVTVLKGGTLPNPSVPATKIIINPGSMKIKAGYSAQLYAKVEPTNALLTDVTWSSTNETIASIDSKGKITANSKGVVLVTAATGSVSNTIVVTVN